MFKNCHVFRLNIAKHFLIPQLLLLPCHNVLLEENPCGRVTLVPVNWSALLWRHNGLDSVSNHQPHNCLVSRLFRSRSKKTSKLRVTGLCVGNSPETGEFPAQRARNAENVSIWWRHNEITAIQSRVYLPVIFMSRNSCHVPVEVTSDADSQVVIFDDFVVLTPVNRVMSDDLGIDLAVFGVFIVMDLIDPDLWHEVESFLVLCVTYGLKIENFVQLWRLHYLSCTISFSTDIKTPIYHKEIMLKATYVCWRNIYDGQTGENPVLIRRLVI